MGPFKVSSNPTSVDPQKQPSSTAHQLLSPGKQWHLNSKHAIYQAGCFSVLVMEQAGLGTAF